MDKKGFELSMNVIIVAAIALIVLVVVLLIFTGKVRTLNKDLEDCGSKGGRCESGVSGAFGYNTCPEGKAKVSADCGDTMVCCIQLT